MGSQPILNARTLFFSNFRERQPSGVGWVARKAKVLLERNRFCSRQLVFGVGSSMLAFHIRFSTGWATRDPLEQYLAALPDAAGSMVGKRRGGGRGFGHPDTEQ